MATRRALVAGLVGLAAVGAVLLASLGRGTPGDVVRVDFDGEPGVMVTSPAVAGQARARAELVASGEAQVLVVPGSPGGGTAARMPGRSAEGVAVIGVSTRGVVDRLSPGEEDFTFGAEVLADPGVDEDGDNIVQRGLADDLGQYKLELDGDRYACTVLGTEGRVTASLETSLTRSVWYGVSCTRDGDTLRLTVRQLGAPESWTAVSTGPIGSVVTASAATPMSIGGKLTPMGEIAAWQPDQFHGIIDAVFLRIG